MQAAKAYPLEIAVEKKTKGMIDLLCLEQGLCYSTLMM